MERIDRLRRAGVSIWLDDLSRELLETGAFQALIDDLGVTGATSNPTIFAKALGSSDRYEPQLGELAASGVADPREAYVELALTDVRAAADALRPIFDATGGRDGFVSLQCTPDLADDTAATVAQACSLARRIGRPNALIKVAATAAGVEAVEELTARGVNVNVTLLFSVARHEEVAEAYAAGLRRRIAAGLPVRRIASVASFFVSRVDATADPQLPAGSPLRGRVAIANARDADRRHRERLDRPAWQALADAGARPQRLLWASTAVKDPASRDVLYLEELVLPGTIVTTPEPTLRAFADHGRVGGSAYVLDPSAARSTLRAASAAGLDLERIAAELERDGVRRFRDAYEHVLETLEPALRRPPRSSARAVTAGRAGS
ncbi:MAG TPA: transaldolase [Capillimicrobium sp.]|nr:transaldolase [Capillimicrobium sp.]